MHGDVCLHGWSECDSGAANASSSEERGTL
jgi:hypothetical protein